MTKFSIVWGGFGLKTTAVASKKQELRIIDVSTNFLELVNVNQTVKQCVSVFHCDDLVFCCFVLFHEFQQSNGNFL